VRLAYCRCDGQPLSGCNSENHILLPDGCCVTLTVNGGATQTVPAGCTLPGGVEACDGVDNDCDGQVDEGTAGVLTCGTGACEASAQCRPGAVCTPGTPTAETCNGLDDDCDGLVDEDFNLGATCQTGDGACEVAGELRCTSDGTAECAPLQTPPQPTPEVCGNGLDEDCNGLAEDCTPPPPLPGPDPNGKKKCPDYKGDPVDMANGNLSYGPLKLISLRMPFGPPLEVSMSYSTAKPGGIFGRGWTMSFEQTTFERGGLIIWQHGAGGGLTFKRPSMWAADEVGLASDAPRPLPDPLLVNNALDGNNVGLYLARVGTQSCGPSCTTDIVAARVVLADGVRHVFGALSASPASIIRSEDAFGNIEGRGVVAFTGGVNLPTLLFRGPREIQLGYDTYPVPFNGEAVGIRAAFIGSQVGLHGDKGVIIDTSPDGFLEEVCRGDLPAQNAGAGCLPRRPDSRCQGLRTVWRFSYQSNLLHEVRDETCYVIERDEYSLQGGRLMVSRTEGPTEVADYAWTQGPTGLVTGATVKTYLQPANPPTGNQQPAFVSSNFGVDAAASRVSSLSDACACGAPVARTWVRTTSGARALQSHSTGVTFRKKSNYDFVANLAANPYRYNLSTRTEEVDDAAAPRLFPVPTRRSDLAYLHHLYRRPTRITADGPSGTRTEVVHDYDDDDPSTPCVEGVPRKPGNPAVANENPTPFLCAVYESSGTPNAQARVTRYRWDAQGRLLQVTRPGGDATRFEYFSDLDPEPRLAGMLKAAISFGPGTPQLRTSFEGYHFSGQPGRAIEPNGAFEHLEHDDRGRLRLRVGPDGEQTETTWEADGKPAAVKLHRGQVHRNTWGTFGRLEKTETFAPGGAQLLFHRSFRYDLAGNVILEEDFDERLGRVTRSAQRDFDQGRRVTREFNAQGGTRVLAYRDALLEQVTDEKLNVTRYLHDSFGRLRRVEAPLGAVSEYDFDARDNLTRVTDANGNATNYTHDGFDLLLRVDSKDTGVTAYDYTIDGLVSRRIDANSTVHGIDTTYDGVRRPISVDRTRLQPLCLPGQVCGPPLVIERTPLTRYFWDNPTAARRALGRLSRVEDVTESGAVMASDFAWDESGRPAKETLTRPGLDGPVELGFDYHAGGKPSLLAYPPQVPGQLPMLLEFALGTDDEVGGVTFGGASVATSVSHYPFGAGLRGFTRGNGLSTTIEQDSDGRRTAMVGGPVSLRYQFDVRGLPRTLTETGDVPRVRSYVHDDLQRLEAATFSASAAAGAPTLFGEVYRYDKAGNRLLKTRADGKRFESVLDWKPGTTDVPANNLLRIVIDPVPGEECDESSGPGNGGTGSRGGGQPQCPPRGLANHELAQLEAGWQQLLNDARDILDALPLLNEAELRGATVDWLERLRALIADYRLSASTLQLLLFSSSSGPHNFADTLAVFVQRRFEGAAVDGMDLDLLKQLLVLARKVPIRKAAELDPIWHYSYSPSGDVTQVVMTMPLSEIRPGAPEFQRSEVKYCYEYNARRQLVRVKYAARYDLTRPPTPACTSSFGFTTLAEYRYTHQNLRVYSKAFGLEKHYVFSREGQVLAELNPEGAVEKAYLYLEGEPLAQVVRRAGTGSSPPISGGMGCSSAGGELGAWLVLGVLVVLARARRRGVARVALASLWLAGCTFEGGFGVERNLGKPPPSKPKKPRPEGARLEDPLYYFHNDRLGTPVRLTDEAGRTVWRAEYRPFGDLQSLEADPDRDRVAVENNLRLPGQYDEALGSLMFQQGPYYNGQRWYLPGEGRYASGEPLAQAPSYMLATRGRVPLYGYAAGSPLQFFDRTGSHISTSFTSWLDWGGGPCQGRGHNADTCFKFATARLLKGCYEKPGCRWSFEYQVSFETLTSFHSSDPNDATPFGGETVAGHESRHLDDFERSSSESVVNQSIATEGFGTRGECEAALRRFTSTLQNYVDWTADQSRSRWDPMEFGR
jgi:RHS repeat-associated protein